MVHTHLEIQEDDLYASTVRRPCAKCLNDVQPSVKYREYSAPSIRGDELTRVWNFRSAGFAEIYGTRGALSLFLSLSACLDFTSIESQFEWLIDNVLILKGVCYWKRCEVMWRDVFEK